jgi:hypothetical protein
MSEVSPSEDESGVPAQSGAAQSGAVPAGGDRPDAPSETPADTIWDPASGEPVPWYLADLEPLPEGYIPPPPEPGGPPYEIEDDYCEDEIGPAQRAGATDDPEYGWDEIRVPVTGPPYPEGMADPLAAQLIDTARDFLHWLVWRIWSPARLMKFGKIWQWQKFDLLEKLRPIELLLRRMLLIEAITLIISQTLPLSAASRPRRAGSRNPAAPDYDPARPEAWRVSFRVVPPSRQARHDRPRRSLPPIDFDLRPGEPRTPLRYRRVLHNAVPVALRLEAALRVVLDPMTYARRLALLLNRRRNPNVSLLIIPARQCGRPWPRDRCSPRANAALSCITRGGVRPELFRHRTKPSCRASSGGNAAPCFALGRTRTAIHRKWFTQRPEPLTGFTTASAGFPPECCPKAAPPYLVCSGADRRLE